MPRGPALAGSRALLGLAGAVQAGQWPKVNSVQPICHGACGVPGPHFTTRFSYRFTHRASRHVREAGSAPTGLGRAAPAGMPGGGGFCPIDGAGHEQDSQQAVGEEGSGPLPSACAVSGAFGSRRLRPSAQPRAKDVRHVARHCSTSAHFVCLVVRWRGSAVVQRQLISLGPTPCVRAPSARRQVKDLKAQLEKNYATFMNHSQAGEPFRPPRWPRSFAARSPGCGSMHPILTVRTSILHAQNGTNGFLKPQPTLASTARVSTPAETGCRAI